jgi:hypothetical protein
VVARRAARSAAMSATARAMRSRRVMVATVPGVMLGAANRLDQLCPCAEPGTVRHSAADVHPRVAPSGALPVGTSDTDRCLVASCRCRRRR